MSTHTEIHREHHEWSRLHAAWKQELKGWQHDHTHLVDLLSRAIELMGCRAHSLHLHGVAIDSLEQKMAVLDNAMEIKEHLGAELQQGHHSTHEEHVRQQQIHEKLQATQRAISEHIQELLELLEPICVIEGTAKVPR